MSKLQWSLPEDQIFEAGLDRGVLYLEEEPGVVWNGLTDVDDLGESTIKNFYLDGIKYLSTASPRDWKGSLTAFTYPDEFAKAIGYVEVGDGLSIDSQVPDRFGLCYRTLINTPGLNQQHYKIHVIFNVIAALSDINNTTLKGTDVDPNEFKFDLSAVPVFVPLRRPTAHFIIDSRTADPVALQEFEDIIYGTDTEDPRMPTVTELLDVLEFKDAVVVVYNGDGTWTATGSNANVRMLDAPNGVFRIDNSSAEWVFPDEIYEFPDVEGESLGESDAYIALDTDGEPYLSDVSGGQIIAIDTDGVYYFTDFSGGMEESLSLHEDTDGVYYVD